jgi:hypothetical protein
MHPKAHRSADVADRFADRTIGTLERIAESRWLDRFSIIAISFTVGYLAGYLQFKLQ